MNALLVLIACICLSGLKAIEVITDSSNSITCAPLYGKGVGNFSSSASQSSPELLLSVEGVAGTGVTPFGYILYEFGDNERIGQMNDSSGEFVYFCNKEQIGKVSSCPDDSFLDKLAFSKKPTMPTVNGWIDGGGSPPAPPPEGGSLKANATLSVDRTGYYCARIINPNGGTFQIQATFQNGYGYLPPEYLPLLPLSIWVSLIYALMLVGWCGLCWRWRREVVRLQKQMAVVLMLFMGEAMISWWFYANYNSTGTPSRTILILLALVGAVRTTASLFLLLITTMGYGIVVPSLGEQARRIHLLASLHLAFSILSITIAATMRNKVSPWGVFLATIPVSTTFFIFISWILSTLHSTKAVLLQRKQTAKLKMYHSLERVLVGLVTLASVMLLVSVIVVIGRSPSQSWYAVHWSHLWLVTDGWQQALSVGSVAILAYLFRPREHNRSYGLQELSAQPLEDEEEPVPKEQMPEEHPKTGHQPIPQWASEPLEVFGDGE